MSPVLKRVLDSFIVVVLLGLPFFVLKANMRAPESQDALERWVVRVSSPVEAAAATMARSVSDVWDAYIYLVDVKRDNRQFAVRQRTLARASTRARTGRGREPPAAAPLAAEGVDRRGDGQRTGDSEGLHRVLSSDEAPSRQGGARRAATHAGHRAGRRRGRSASRRRRHGRRQARSRRGVRDRRGRRANARPRLRARYRGSDPLHLQSGDGGLARRGRDRRSARDQRQGPLVSSGYPRGPRDEGDQTRARPRSGRSDAVPGGLPLDSTPSSSLLTAFGEDLPTLPASNQAPSAPRGKP